ncbi:MAG: hypothetical protein ABIG03_06865 [Candidatus Eisenbacteria bacterium]
MRKIILLATIIVFALVVAGCPQAEKPPEKPKSVIPRGKVLVSEELLRSFSDQPGTHMKLARDAARRGDKKTSAQEASLAASFMKLERIRAKGPGKAALKVAIDEMMALARDLEQNTAASNASPSPILARAHHALAVHHYHVAAAAWKAKAPKRAGHDLAAAAGDAEAIFKWIRRAATTDEKAAVAAARDLASKITAGTPLAADEAATGLAALKAHIDALAADVAPAP